MDDNKYLTVAEVARRLNMHPGSIRRYIERGQLPVVRVGTRAIRVREEDLELLVRPANGRPPKEH